MAPKLTKEALDFYTNRFELLDDSDMAYTDIMKYEFSMCKTESEQERFIEYFYIVSKNVEKNVEDIIANIYSKESPARFNFVHGYAKNGKTSFSYYFKYICQKDHEHNVHILPTINFGETRSGKIVTDFRGIAKGVFIAYLKYASGGEKKEAIIDERFQKLKEFIDFIRANINEDQANRFFPEIIMKIGHLLDFALTQINAGVDRDLKIAMIDGRLSHLEIDPSQACDMMTFYILVRIYTDAGNSKAMANKKILVFFDNIDEILTGTAEDIAGNYVVNVCDVLENFDLYLGGAYREATGISIRRNLSFIFHIKQ